MSPRTLVIAALCLAIVVLTAPLIPHAIDSFKTFIEFRSLLGPYCTTGVCPGHPHAADHLCNEGWHCGPYPKTE